MERRRPVDSRAAGVRERAPHGSAVGALHVLRPRRAGLERLRLGDPAARDRLPRNLPLPPARRAPVPAAAAAARDHLAAALADLPDHAGSWPDQAARRSLLAAAHVPLLPLRDPADPEPAQPHAAFHAPVVPPRRRPLQSSDGARGAVVRILAAPGTPR